MLYVTLILFLLVVIFIVWDMYTVYHLKELSLFKTLPLYFYIKWTYVGLWFIHVKFKIITIFREV